MMQATPLKQTVKTELLNKNFNSALVQGLNEKADQPTTPKSGNLSKAQSFNRFLEAYGDCV